MPPSGPRSTNVFGLNRWHLVTDEPRLVPYIQSVGGSRDR
jgi:hypothetical protein